MKKLKKFVVLFLFVLAYSSIYADNVDINTACAVAENKISLSRKSELFSVKDISEISENNTKLFYLVELTPKGFMIISADDRLNPVIAYSFDNDADINAAPTNFFKNDIKTRLLNAERLPQEILSQREAEWNEILTPDLSKGSRFEQWPAEGTTTTGGWLKSSWNQTYPWNAMCPLDPVAGGRSYTGCPATAMAMILNFHKNTNNIHFGDEDDYYHSYYGRNYQIDDDYEANGFPSFDQLNQLLDTMNAHWLKGMNPTNDDMAALSFACGVAATQVYTSEMSGTFSVNQAYDAYLRFGCDDAILYRKENEELFPTLISNMQNALPAHLAIEDAGGTMGHNVVVDGYNTDNYFHVNFGYGGSYNAWCIVPDQMPFGLTVIEGIIVDIMKNYVSAEEMEVADNEISVYPNPAKGEINVFSNDVNFTKVKIFDMSGRMISEMQISDSKVTIDTESMQSGIYLLQIFDGNAIVKNQKVIVAK